MEFVNISEETFDKLKGNRGKKDIPMTGSLDGNYEELISYLNWILESSHNDNAILLKEALNKLNDNFKMSGTTIQFLMNNMRKDFPHKTMRVRYLLNQIGMTTEIANRYFYATITSKMRLRMSDGTDRSYSVGHHYRRLEKEEFDLIIDKMKHDEKIKEITTRFFEADEKKKKQQEEQKSKIEIQEVKPDVPCIKLNCKRCSKIMEIPTTPNLETDKDEAFVSEIYSVLIQDIQDGIRYCSKCRNDFEKDGMWKIEAIETWLNENKGNTLRFSAEDFCKDFRKDGMIVSPMTIKGILNKVAIPVEVRTSGEELKIKIN